MVRNHSGFPIGAYWHIGGAQAQSGRATGIKPSICLSSDMRFAAGKIFHSILFSDTRGCLSRARGCDSAAKDACSNNAPTSALLVSA